MSKYNFLDGFEFKNGQQLKNKVIMAPMTTMTSFHNAWSLQMKSIITLLVLEALE